MTPEIHKKYDALKLVTEMLIPTLMVFEKLDLDNFPDEARHFADGTMSAILPHFMSIQDMNTSQKNLSHAIEVAKTLSRLKKLLVHVQPENGA